MIFLHQFFFQRTAVDPHTDGYAPFSGHGHHRRHLVTASDVSRIDADLVCPVFHSRNGHFIVKMNIRHQRNMYLLPDPAECLCRFDGRNRTTYDLTSRLLQAQDLRHCCFHILRPRIGHRLDQYGIPPADHPVSDFHHFCMFTMHNHSPSFPGTALCFYHTISCVKKYRLHMHSGYCSHAPQSRHVHSHFSVSHTCFSTTLIKDRRRIHGFPLPHSPRSFRT